MQYDDPLNGNQTHGGRGAVVLSGDALELVGVLGGAADVDLVLVHLDLEARGEEGVEAHYQVRVTFEEVGDPADHPRSVDAGERGESVSEKGSSAETIVL